MAQVALVEIANTNNITIVPEGNYRLDLPDGSQVSPVEAGWVGEFYRLSPIDFDDVIPTYVESVEIGSNTGLNYTNNNVLTLSGGTAVGNVGQLQVHGIGSNGIVTSLIVANSGYYTESPPSPNVPTGGTGTGLVANVTFTPYEIASQSYNYDANTNLVIEENTYVTPVIDNFASLESQRQNNLKLDPGNVNLRDKLKTATPQQIDAWLLNNVTNLAEARAVLGSIIKLLANMFASRIN